MREHFGAWNLYHKISMILIIGIVAAILIKALLAIEGGAYEVRTKAAIHAPAPLLWSFVIDPANRVRWEADLIDFSKLSGDADKVQSTRYLFWRTRGERWSAQEITTEIAPGLVYGTYQESLRDTRSVRIELAPLDSCMTEVTLVNIIRPAKYQDRFWSLMRAYRDQTRLDVSAGALDRWMRSKSDCAGGKATAS